MSLSRNRIAPATGAGSSVSQPSGAWRCQAVGEIAEARDAARRERPERARRTRGSRARRADRGRARGSATPPRARPWRRPSSRRPARRPRRRSRGRRRSPPPRGTGRRAPAASAFSENALVRNATSALSAGVSRKLPPSASSGAKAIACRMPSTRPQRSRSSSATASRSSGLLTSSSSTSGGVELGSPTARSCRRTRPNEVRTTSAPASWAWRATSYAIDSRVTTPVMSSFLSFSMHTS